MTIDPNLGILICSHVFQKTRPVLLVSRPNSDLQLLCGDVHKDRPHGVCIGHLLERDPSLHEVVDLPIGWEAERKGQGGPWIRSRCQDGEEHRFANPAPMDGSFRRRLRNVGAFVMMSAAIIYMLVGNPTTVAQRWRLARANRYQNEISQRLAKDLRYGQVKVTVRPTTGGGAILVMGTVSSDSDLESLRGVVQSTRPPDPVEYRVVIAPK